MWVFIFSVITNPLFNLFQFLLSSLSNRSRIIFINSAQVQMMRTFRDDYDFYFVIWATHNTTTAPRIQQSVAEHNVWCSTETNRIRLSVQYNRLIWKVTHNCRSNLLQMWSTVISNHRIFPWTYVEFLKTIVTELLKIPILWRKHIFCARRAHRHHHFGASLKVPAIIAHLTVIRRWYVQALGLTRVIAVHRYSQLKSLCSFFWIRQVRAKI